MIPLGRHSGELVEPHWGIPGCRHPATPWNLLDPRLAEGLAGKGLGLGWVFTVTTKAQLCGTFLGEELGMEELNPPPGSSRGDNGALHGLGCSLRMEIQAGMIPVPLGSVRDPAGSRGEEEEAEPWLSPRVDWIIGKIPKSLERPRIDGFPLLFESPGRTVFLRCRLNPSTTHGAGENPALAPPRCPLRGCPGCGPRPSGAFGKGRIFRSKLCKEIQLRYFN